MKDRDSFQRNERKVFLNDDFNCGLYFIRHLASVQTQYLHAMNYSLNWPRSELAPITKCAITACSECAR